MVLRVNLRKIFSGNKNNSGIWQFTKEWWWVRMSIRVGSWFSNRPGSGWRFSRTKGLSMTYASRVIGYFMVIADNFMEIVRQLYWLTDLSLIEILHHRQTNFNRTFSITVLSFSNPTKSILNKKNIDFKWIWTSSVAVRSHWLNRFFQSNIPLPATPKPAVTIWTNTWAYRRAVTHAFLSDLIPRWELRRRPPRLLHTDLVFYGVSVTRGQDVFL